MVNQNQRCNRCGYELFRGLLLKGERIGFEPSDVLEQPLIHLIVQVLGPSTGRGLAQYHDGRGDLGHPLQITSAPS